METASTFSPKVRVMGILKSSQWGFVALKHYETACELPRIRILQIQSPLTYSNADYVVKQVLTFSSEEYVANAVPPTIIVDKMSTLKRNGMSLSNILAQKNPAIRALAKSNTLGSFSDLRIEAMTRSAVAVQDSINSNESSSGLLLSTTLPRPASSTPTTTMSNASRVILDLGSVGYIDTVGIRALEQMASDLRSQNVEMILAQCTGSLLKQLKELETHKIIPERNIFPSVVDAVEESVRRNHVNTSPAAGATVEEYEDDRFWDMPVVPVEGLPVVDYHQD